MTHLNTFQSTHPAKDSRETAPGTLIWQIGARTKTWLRLVLSIPVALASGVAEVALAIGKATAMTYVDPFTPNRKNRK